MKYFLLPQLKDIFHIYKLLYVLSSFKILFKYQPYYFQRFLSLLLINNPLILCKEDFIIIQMSNHSELHEEKLEDHKHQEHDQHVRLHKKHIDPLPQNLDFKSKRLIFWIPVLSALIFVLIGIAKKITAQQEKFYCYKSTFTPTGFSQTARQTSERQLLVNTRYGFQLYVDPLDEKTSKKIAEQGSYEPAQVNLMGQIVKQGDKVLSVGQYVGLNAVVMAKVIGQKGKLFVFTPFKISYNLISKNIKLNNVQKNTQIYNFGTSNHSFKGTIEVISPDGNKQMQEIQYEVLDQIIPPNDKFNFAYINLQKMEIQTLLGMKDIIKRSPELVILVKWQYSKENIINRGEMLALIQLLSGVGYKIYSYKGGSYGGSCQLGSFIWKGELQNLLNIKGQTLILFPQGYVLPI